MENQPPAGTESNRPPSPPRSEPEPRGVLGGLVRVLVVLLCAGGVWVTRELSLDHGGAKTEGFNLFQFGCSPRWGEGVSCDQVLRGPYAYLRIPRDACRLVRPLYGGDCPAEIPVAWLGLAYFSVLLVWYLFVGRPSYSRRGLHLVPLMLVGTGIIGSAWFMYLLFFRLPAICPLCVTTHAINLLVLLCTLALWPRRPRPVEGVVYRPRPPWGQTAAAVVLSVFVVLAALTRYDYAGAKTTVEFLQKELKELNSNPRVMEAIYRDKWAKAVAALPGEKRYEIPVDPDEPVLGDRNARRTIVMFSDLECPACKAMHARIRRQLWPLIQQLAAPQGGVRFVFKHYPLYSQCNPRAQTNLHPFSCDAARAAEAARELGGADAYWSMVDRIYDNYESLNTGPYDRLATEAGFDPKRFREAMASPAVRDRIARHVEQGAAVGMVSTPGFYLDGVRVTDFVQFGEKGWQYVLRQSPWPPVAAPTTQPAGPPS